MKENNFENEKVVLFPGLIERMLTNAVQAMENQRYEEAIEYFEQLFTHYQGDEYSLSVFVHCLYEVKNYERAKEVCETLIGLEPENYFEVMELYLTICMQLKQFLQVEKIIHSMFERNIIPAEQIEKFQRIQALNEEIAEKKQQLEERVVEQAEDYAELLQKDSFLAKSNFEKLSIIQELGALNIRPYMEELLTIVSAKELHPFLKSLILIMLVEQQVVAEVKVEKLGQERVLQLADLPLPTKLPQFEYVQHHVMEHFGNNPSFAELVFDVMVKHAVVAYPFEWQAFDLDEVVATYQGYIEEMFGQTTTNFNEQLLQYIQMLEMLSELDEL